jgi:hypothetical protein
MRVSEREREEVAALLSARCAEGYLSVDTLEERMALALQAQTVGELRALVADITRASRPWLRRLRGPRGAGAVAVSLPRRGAVVLGRSSACDVVLRDPTVSRRHAELRAIDGAWLAVDLGSMNGTWLLGRRVGRVRVESGDELMLGDCAVVLGLTAPAGS